MLRESMLKMALKLMLTKLRLKHEMCFFQMLFKNTAEGLMSELHVGFFFNIARVANSCPQSGRLSRY